MSTRVTFAILVPLALGSCQVPPRSAETTPAPSRPRRITPRADVAPALAAAPPRAPAPAGPVLFQPGLRAHGVLARIVRRSSREALRQAGKCFDLAPDPCAAVSLVVGVDLLVDASGQVTAAQPGDFEEWRRRWGSQNPYHLRAVVDAPGVGTPSPSGIAPYPDADRDFVRCVVDAIRSTRFELPPGTPAMRLWFPYHVTAAC